MDEKNEKQIEKETQHIPWLDKFEAMSKESAESPDPDIDFITRLHELEGR